MTPAPPELRWLTQPADLSALRPDWEQLAAQTGADPYLWPLWQEVWWAHFGPGRRLACLTGWRDGRLVALLPFAVETIWVGPLPLRIARLAGTDPHCLVFRLPVTEEDLSAVLAAALRHLLGPMGCAAVSLTPASERAAWLAPLRALTAAERGWVCTMADAGSHIVFDLPPTFDLLLQRLSKKRRAQIRRDLATLRAEFGLTETCGPPDRAAFAAFAEFHNRQWQAIGRAGHFGEWPGSADFYGDLADRGQREDRSLMQVHRLQGRAGPLASQFTLCAGDIAHWRLPARTLDPEAERLGIGKLGLLLMLRDLIDQGCILVEAGRGDYDYKLAYGGTDVPVWQVLLAPATLAGRVRLHLLTGWAALVNLLYYRIWFWKVAPRLRRWSGRKPGPLWRGWIRTRL